ncbi:TPA: hypothetical protein ACGBUE_005485, partial [Klebsiella michiganensis]
HRLREIQPLCALLPGAALNAPCPGYGFSVVCGPVAGQMRQHRLREIQPHCTPLPGAAQSALPGLRVQRCLRAV